MQVSLKEASFFPLIWWFEGRSSTLGPCLLISVKSCIRVMLDSGLHHLYFKGLSQKLDFFIFLVHLYLMKLNTREMVPEAKLIKSPVLRSMCVVRGKHNSKIHIFTSLFPLQTEEGSSLQVSPRVSALTAWELAKFSFQDPKAFKDTEFSISQIRL